MQTEMASPVHWFDVVSRGVQRAPGNSQRATPAGLLVVQLPPTAPHLISVCAIKPPAQWRTESASHESLASFAAHGGASLPGTTHAATAPVAVAHCRPLSAQSYSVNDACAGA